MTSKLTEEGGCGANDDIINKENNVFKDGIGV